MGCGKIPGGCQYRELSYTRGSLARLASTLAGFQPLLSSIAMSSSSVFVEGFFFVLTSFLLCFPSLFYSFLGFDCFLLWLWETRTRAPLLQKDFWTSSASVCVSRAVPAPRSLPTNQVARLVMIHSLAKFDHRGAE